MKRCRLARFAPLAALLAALIVWPIVPLQAADDVVFKALNDELQRSIQELKLADLEKPYFIAYSVQDGRIQTFSASFGSLLEKNDQRLRLLTVEVRVGDQAFDNTNFLAVPLGTSGVTRLVGGTVTIPLEDDYEEIRRQVWLATDGAYKKALEDMAGKRAAFRNRTQPEDIPDFSNLPFFLGFCWSNALEKRNLEINARMR